MVVELITFTPLCSHNASTESSKVPRLDPHALKRPQMQQRPMLPPHQAGGIFSHGNLDQLFAQVLALQHSDEGTRSVFQTLLDGLFVLELSFAEPGGQL